jgi:large subunit ribosomal protein L29
VKAQQIRELSVDDLRGKQRELAEQLFRLRLQKSIGQLDNALKIRAVRRDMARVLTVLKQKQSATSPAS